MRPPPSMVEVPLARNGPRTVRRCEGVEVPMPTEPVRWGGPVTARPPASTVPPAETRRPAEEANPANDPPPLKVDVSVPVDTTFPPVRRKSATVDSMPQLEHI